VVCAQLKRFSLDIPNNFMKVGKRDSEVKPYFHSCYLRPTKWYVRRPGTPPPGLGPLIKEIHHPAQGLTINRLPASTSGIGTNHAPNKIHPGPRQRSQVASPMKSQDHEGKPLHEQETNPKEINPAKARTQETNRGGRQPFRARRST